MNLKITLTALFAGLIILSCSKENGGPPVLETVEATVNSNGDLIMKGRIIDANGSDIVATGFCIGLDKQVPSMTDNQQLAVIDGENFTQVVPDIISNQDLYVRAFALNEYEYAYGGIIHVNYVPGPPSVPCTLPANTVSFDYLNPPNYSSSAVTYSALNTAYAGFGEIGALISNSSGRPDIVVEFNETPSNGVYKTASLSRFDDGYPKEVRIVIQHNNHEEALPDQNLYVTELAGGKIRIEFCETEYKINGSFTAHVKGSAEM